MVSRNMARLLARILMSTALMMAFAVWAGQVSPAQATNVARNWVSHVVAQDGSWNGTAVPTVREAVPITQEGTVVAYVARVSPMGFVLVPAEDVLPPVKAFSTTSDFVAGRKDFEEWVSHELLNLITVLRQERGASVTFSPKSAEAWRWLSASGSDFRALRAETTSVVTPFLLTTKWDQGYPYNMLCPTLNGQETWVGCVATCTAQAMKYWNYPPQGQGTASYSWHGQTLTANFAHPYDWANMPDQVSGSSTDAQKTAIATLSYEVGVAFHMDYDPSGSGAYTTDATTILPSHFFYSADVNAKNYAGNDQDWFLQFQKEVDAARPSLFSIRGVDGGHAVVADGYRTDGISMVHLNMGWSGAYNGYYATNNIVAGGTAFSDLASQSLVVNIHPPTLPDPAVLTNASLVSGTAPLPINVAAQAKWGTPPFTYSWDFGDGSPSASGNYANHIFAAPGTYTLTCTLTDSAGKTAVDSHLKVTVNASQGFAAAAVSSVTAGTTPLAVSFAASAVGGQPPYTYAWDFRDGTTGAGETVQHTFTGINTFWIDLIATDSTGATAEDSHLSITTVSALPPPEITKVSKASNPLRLKITGSHFQPNCVILINETPVPQTAYKSATSLQGKGSGLKTMMPKGQTVYITVRNPDGAESDAFTLNN